MRPVLKTFNLLLLIVFQISPASTTSTQSKSAEHVSKLPQVLKTETFNLTQEMEVGLEIEARAPFASWSRKGAEAAAVLISVNGSYNQDLLLWAGDEVYKYRVMLGRLAKGRHKISVSLNLARSAEGARLAEVKSLRPLLFAGTLRSNSEEEQLALAHTPFLYARANTIDRFTDIPLLMYYEILRELGGDLIVRYTIVFSNEDGGTRTAALMARWGRATDIEWVYQFRARAGKIIEETYQGVEHETKLFTGSRINGSHPLLAVASDNNNFSDLACAAVRFAPFPIRARLEKATRESMMDLYPQTYRVMTEELIREKRISDAVGDIDAIADPREYLYIEAGSEQVGTALSFEVKVSGETRVFSSDAGDPALRIDRSGYFRTAVRLGKGVEPAKIETISARCHESSQNANQRRCKHLKFMRALMLDKNYVPNSLRLQADGEFTLVPGATKVVRIQR